VSVLVKKTTMMYSCLMIAGLQECVNLFEMQRTSWQTILGHLVRLNVFPEL